jgi:uncharacterized membrane protein required for colicin V production
VLDFFASATLIDIVILLVAMGLFVVGWLQGAIRQLLSIAGLLASFLLAAGLRQPLGDFLARNWTFNDRGFDFMLALLALGLAIAITVQIGIQAFYRRVVIHQRLVIVDEILGGLLGAFQVFLVIALVVIVFDSYYATVDRAAQPRDAPWARSIWDLLKSSAIVAGLRDSLVPAIVAVLGGLLPADIVKSAR